MSIRDILLSVLLVFNMYFAYVIGDLNMAKEETTVIVAAEPSTEEPSKNMYNNYATLYMFKQILPADIFAEILLPEIEAAFKDGAINASEWLNIQEKIKNIESLNTINFNELYLSQMQKKDLGNTLDQMLEDLGDEANVFSDTLKQDFKSFVEENKDIFKSKDAEQNTPNKNANPQDSNKTQNDKSISL